MEQILRDISKGTVSNNFDTSQHSFLPQYVSPQLGALRALLNRVDGTRLGKTLERIHNETTERNEWPIQFIEGRPEGSSETIEPTVYHALLVKTIHYAVSVIGANICREANKSG